tara:strand:+ start:75 stop:500 length:426 start_codon:yes stop_codon:yes gene_type:complete
MSYVTRAIYDQDIGALEYRIGENERLARSLTTTNRNLFEKMDTQHRVELHSIFNAAKDHRDSNSEKIENMRTGQLKKADVERIITDYYGDDIQALYDHSHNGGDWFKDFKKWLESFGIGLGVGGVAVAGLAIYFLLLRGRK